MQLDLLDWTTVPTASKAAAPWCAEDAAVLVKLVKQVPHPSLEKIGAKLGRPVPPTERVIPVAFYVVAWQPLPEGVDSYMHHNDIFPPQPEHFGRPAESVYEPARPTVRLMPVPRDLLIAMAGGAVLHKRWTSWTLQRPGQAPEKAGERCINRLRELAFIARDCVLPVPGRLTRFYDFDWSITAAGRAWLAANLGS